MTLALSLFVCEETVAKSISKFLRKVEVVKLGRVESRTLSKSIRFFFIYCNVHIIQCTCVRCKIFITLGSSFVPL